MSFINQITDFEIALETLEPNIAKAIRKQVPTPANASKILIII